MNTGPELKQQKFLKQCRNKKRKCKPLKFSQQKPTRQAAIFAFILPFWQSSQAVLFFMLEALVFSFQRADLHVSMVDKTFNSFVFLFPPTSALFSRAYLQPGYNCGWEDICKAFIDESVILCLKLIVCAYIAVFSALVSTGMVAKHTEIHIPTVNTYASVFNYSTFTIRIRTIWYSN